MTRLEQSLLTLVGALCEERHGANDEAARVPELLVKITELEASNQILRVCNKEQARRLEERRRKKK